MPVLPFAVSSNPHSSERLQALRILFIGLGIYFFLTAGAAAQELSADEYFQQARKTAFDQKNYPAAIRLCKQALKQSPDDLDIQILLGRL